MTNPNIIKNTASEPIEIEELAAFLDENVDFSCSDSIKVSSEQFGRLFLNKNLIKNHILNSLKNGISRFDVNNSYTPPSLILHTSRKYFIRANMWRPIETYSKDDINLYGLAHDHNFDFLTLNYSGPGYISEMYEYDYSSLNGEVGEHVDLLKKPDLQLNEGEMYLYRKNIDVHSQLPPSKPTITINLMVNLNMEEHSYQYIFDLNKSIVKEVYGGFHAKKHVFDMARLLGEPECDELLVDIGKSTSCHLTKRYLQKFTA